MDLSVYISLFAAVVSAVAAVLAWRESRTGLQIAHTPILFPDIRKVENRFQMVLRNNHSTGLAQGLSVKIFKGKLSREISKTDEFVSPGTETRLPDFEESPDGARFCIEYKNFFNQKVIIEGSIHELSGNVFDCQDISFSMK